MTRNDADRPPADELYVDTADERLVLDTFSAVAPELVLGTTERSPGLGLTRVEFTRPVGDEVQVDDVLAAVRAVLAARYHGWSPVFDRAHDLSDVGTHPHVKGGPNPPEEVEAPSSAARPATAPTGPDGPRVGIADGAIFPHPALAGRYEGDTWAGAGPFTTALPAHATFVAGTVLSRAPQARLVCRAVLQPRPEASNSPWAVANRLIAFLADDVDVINMSFGCRTDGGVPLPLRRAVERLAVRSLLVAAGGNHGESEPTRQVFPGVFSPVVAVGAAAGPGAGPAAGASGLAPFSRSVPWLDLTAPGVDLVGPFVAGSIESETVTGDFSTGYVKWSGSSFAAAGVSGALARLIGEEGIDARAALDRLRAGAVEDIGAFAFHPEQPPVGS